MNSPVCIAVHGIFAGDAFEELKRVGAGSVVSTNTIVDEFNAIEIDKLLSDALTS